MRLLRFRLLPRSPWLTPWQADTLMGLLCWACARREGDAVLRRELLEPAARGEPPFVLSDAFPGDMLPLPVSLRAQPWPLEQRKAVKRVRWLTRAAFQRVQAGQLPSLEELRGGDPIAKHLHLRNTIGREANSTDAARGGALFSTREFFLNGHDSTQFPYLSIYARVAEGKLAFLHALLNELATIGYGRDASVGKGEFTVDGAPEPAEWLSDDLDGADALITLSTFQPAARDPTAGAWESFVKYGKLGPDFGVHNVAKRPLVMLRPGACFEVERQRPFLGRTIPTAQLLAPDVCQTLAARGVEVAQLAWALAVPARRLRAVGEAE